MVIVNKVTFYCKVEKFRISLPDFVWETDKDIQSFRKIYAVVMELNRFFAVHFFANGLYISICLYKNMFCDPSLEPFCQDGSNEGSQHMLFFF